MIDANYQVRETEKIRMTKGGGRHEAAHAYGTVSGAGDGGVDASIDRCPGTRGIKSENCHPALVGDETKNTADTG